MSRPYKRGQSFMIAGRHFLRRLNGNWSGSCIEPARTAWPSQIAKLRPLRMTAAGRSYPSANGCFYSL